MDHSPKPQPVLSVSGTLAGLSLSVILSSLGTSIANVALPTMAQALDASFEQIQWVILVFLVAVTALIVTAGRLGDIVGRRRLLLAGIGLFTVASLLCGMAPSLWFLLAARAAQGAGAATMMALTMALVGETVPKEKIGRAMGLLGTMSAVGTALGPSLGGILIAGLGWQAIFWVNVPVGAATLVLVYRFLPADQRESKPTRIPFDPSGTVLLTVTLVAYALSMTLGHGSFGLLNAVLLAVAAMGVGLFLFVESRTVSPLIQLTELRKPLLRHSLVMNALVSTVMMATLVVGPFYLSLSLGLSPALVGLVMAVGPVTSALCGIPAGRLVDHHSPTSMVIAGLLAMVLGCLALSVLPPLLGVVGYIAAIVILTPGYQLFQAANNTAAMAGVKPDRRGVISGMLNLARHLGLVTGASAMGALFASASGDANQGLQVTFGAACLFALCALGVGWTLERARW